MISGARSPTARAAPGGALVSSTYATVPRLLTAHDLLGCFACDVDAYFPESLTDARSGFPDQLFNTRGRRLSTRAGGRDILQRDLELFAI
jgi:hypothetical protein